jgi:hypothetical protein
MGQAFPLSILLLATLLPLIGCGGSRTVGEESKKPTNNNEAPRELSPTESATALLHIALEMEALPTEPPTTRVTIVETNETGANTRHDQGVFEGECRDATEDVRSTEPEVFLAFHCQPFEGQRGVLVHILHRQSRLILLRAWLGSSKPTFDEFDQIGELPPFPGGVPLRTDFDK